MKYFQLRQGSELHNILGILWQADYAIPYHVTKQLYDEMERLQVAYYNYNDNLELPDVLEYPTFLVSEMVKKVMKMYDDEISFKGLQLYPTEYEKKMAPFYWLPYIEEYNCLHESSRLLPNGTVDELVLEALQIPDKEIFRVAGIQENRIIVSLPVAESILRRKPYGVWLEKVRIL